MKDTGFVNYTRFYRLEARLESFGDKDVRLRLEIWVRGFGGVIAYLDEKTAVGLANYILNAFQAKPPERVDI